MPQSHSALIETDALQERLDQPNLKILDASYHIPPSSRQAKTEYEENHIPGALFFDIDAISDTNASLPHMLPTPDEFERHMQAMAIGSQDNVVIYDVHGIMSAPRAWWMFRYFGHERVYVLNGGLPKWLAENRPTQTSSTTIKYQNQAQNTVFKASINPQLLCPLKKLKEAVDTIDSAKPGVLSSQVVDMRSAKRFYGEEPEPRQGLRSGHIPGSLNVPWGSWLQADKTLLPVTDLRNKCKQAGLDWNKPVVTTCGSGITACLGALALHELGNTSVSVYDGAWAEWGGLKDLPIA